MKSTKNEMNLYKPVLKLFSGFGDVFAEVPFFRKSVDLVFRSYESSGEIIAVELKISDWKRAAIQAAENQLFADYSFIALPKRFAIPEINEKLKTSLEDLGVGLISVDNEATIILSAEQSPYIKDEYRRTICVKLDHASRTNNISREEFEHGIPAKSPRSTAFLPIGSY